MRKLLPLWLAAAACLPGLTCSLLSVPMTPPAAAAVSGVAILGASFLLLWACDVAQHDIPQALALAVVALIAVLPEYAVDMYFTWMAGQHPESDYAHFAIANMTGANRLLIGVAWTAVALVVWWRTRRPVILEPARRTEVLFLGLATAYAMSIPLSGTLTWVDGAALIGLYVVYIVIAARRECEEPELEGVAACLARLTAGRRRLTTAALFLFAAGVIVANAEHFSEGLVATGRMFGVSEFLLVQWLAPIASEAPEFIVAIMFALRGMAGMALGSLVSSKLNQWTLLVGMIPGVYGVSSGSFAVPMPLDGMQMHEILLTAAQSLLAVGLLAGLRLDIRGALLLFGLFCGQFLAPAVPEAFWRHLPGHVNGAQVHFFFTFLYVGVFVLLLPRIAPQLAALVRPKGRSAS
ncbi:sodium:calcium antiporter [Solidesulfovibrio sp.]|uniref:sodium:calcium antiporter n=1 Tax=Solidesulfovibrio sp. TaxID=2910990 RepID=UPI000EEC552D|nr:sodium:calcium antiporter [Solidesulfovibrio sp.]MEA5090580.1 sodium:calcium antiporter [Solidesulfovibrio sp.]HCR13038.1 sodium:proton exchanger [Desulfovibrio sp.]HML60599.1 sodium:calcium antiporter [Solidesulfovibrio sp.]